MNAPCYLGLILSVSVILNAGEEYEQERRKCKTDDNRTLWRQRKKIDWNARKFRRETVKIERGVWIVFLKNGSYVVVNRDFSCISISTVFLRRASVMLLFSFWSFLVIYYSTVNILRCAWRMTITVPATTCWWYKQSLDNSKIRAYQDRRNRRTCYE